MAPQWKTGSTFEAVFLSKSLNLLAESEVPLGKSNTQMDVGVDRMVHALHDMGNIDVSRVILSYSR
jgi:hypothetical protein